MHTDQASINACVNYGTLHYSDTMWVLCGCFGFVVRLDRMQFAIILL